MATYKYKVKDGGKYSDWMPISDDQYYGEELYGQGPTADSVGNEIETQNNSALGWMKDGLDSGVASVLAGQLSFLNEKTGIGGGAANYMYDVARDNQKRENPEFGTLDYILNPVHKTVLGRKPYLY